MDDIIKALTAKDDLRLRITDQEDGTFRFALLSNGMERGIKLLNMRLMEGQRAPEWPNFDYVFDATLPADGARSFLKAAKVANDFLITTESDASGNGISWAIRDDREPLVWRPQDVIVNSPNDAVSAYSVEAVNSLVSATVGKQEIRLRGGNDTPVEISWNPHDGIAMAALMNSKPTNYQAAKSMIEIGEEVTSAHVIDRLIQTGRREVPSRRQLSALMKKDTDFVIVRRNGSKGPIVFKRRA